MDAFTVLLLLGILMIMGLFAIYHALRILNNNMYDQNEKIIKLLKEINEKQK